MSEDKKELALQYFNEAYELQKEGMQLQMHNMQGWYKKFQEAIDLYKKSIVTYPTAEAHTFLGWTYSFIDRYDEAIEECLKAIEVDPDFGNPYNDIGVYLIEKGQLDEAIPWLEKAIYASRYEARHYPHANLGRIWERKWEWEKAIKAYKEALKEEPNYTDARRALKRLQGLLN